MTIQNLNYYRQRADEELAAAEGATDPGIAQIQREMARRYRDLISGDAGAMNGHSVQPVGAAIAEPGPVAA